MSNHDKLSQELGANPEDVAGIELTEGDLEQVAGGDTTTIIRETTIIRDEEAT